jgi:glycosyltransferase involved in cell wall biosynthesis
VAAALRDAGVAVTWTMQGTGPDVDALRAEWADPAVRWTGRQPMAQVLAEYERHDVLVMPSRHEGLPVALLEAGAAGVVPVASDLASGIPEIVRSGDTGWRATPGDARQFAEAIAALARDRVRFESMSAAIREVVERDWDIRRNAAEYERLFERWAELRRPRAARRQVPYGSRLDRRWLPNVMVRAIRTLRARSGSAVGQSHG